MEYNIHSTGGFYKGNLPLSKMAAEKKSRTIHLYITSGVFSSIFKRFKGEKNEYDFSGIKDLRQLLSNEKARLLHLVKVKTPESIYALAKLLNRDFNSVRKDLIVLQKFGFIELQRTVKGNRKQLKPVLSIDSLNIILEFK